MSAQKNVTLPKHLWVALDDMSRDGAQPADALVEMAVEQFVTLQGYELPRLPVATGLAPVVIPETQAPRGLQDDDEDPIEYARTMARPAHQTNDRKAHEPDEAPAATNMAPAHTPTPEDQPAAKLGPPVLTPEDQPATNMAPAHTPLDEAQATNMVPKHEPLPPPVMTDVSAAHAPVHTDVGPAHKPAAAKARAPAPAPAWVTRAPRTDADDERAAVRQQLDAIEKDLERLTLERPTTEPLTADAADADEE